MIEIRHADSLRALERLPRGKFDMTVLDMPWGKFGPTSSHPDVQWDHLPPINRLGEMVDGSLAPYGYVIIFGDREHLDLVDDLWSPLFTIRDRLIWAKPGNIPTNSLKPLPVHEFIHIYMRKDLKVNQCTWNPRVLPGKPYIRKGTSGSVSTRRQTKSARHENTTGMRHLKSVIYAPNKPAMRAWEKEGMHHPTMKPVQLLSQIIRAYSNPGDSVLDPFSGSGSTALTCFLTGRKCISYENNSKWFQQSITRFNSVKVLLGPGQVEQLLRQPELQIDEFDMALLYP